MIAPQPQQNPDHLGYIQTLRMVLQDPALNEFKLDGSLSPETASAILLLAQTIGYCRLYTVVVQPDLDGSLPPATAISAAEILAGVLQHAMQDAEDYVERWELCTSQEEMELQACDLLRTRMHVWATFVAIDEGAVAAARDHHPDTDELERRVAELADSIQQFDTALRRDAELLTSALETRLIENWRSMLAEDYRRALPWWLDGTLERTASQIQQSMSVPGAAAGTLADDETLPVMPLADLQRLVQLQSVPAVPVLVAQSPTQIPHQSVLEWKSPTESVHLTAMLLIPRQRDESGRTACRMQFRGTEKAELAGKPVALGNARAIIQSRDLPGLPGDPVIEAVFFLENLQLQDSHFYLRVEGQRWTELYPQERSGE